MLVVQYIQDWSVQRRGIIERYIDEIVATQAIIRVRGYVPLEKEQEYVNFKTVCRNCGAAECRQVDTI